MYLAAGMVRIDALPATASMKFWKFASKI